MSVTITYLGHSGFLLTAENHRVAVDPFLTGNPLAQHKPAELKPTAIALTHGHADHFGDTVALAQSSGATVFAAFEITEFLAGQGIENTSPGNPGGKITTDFGFIAFTQAFHSSSYNGQYMGMPCGLIINMAGVTFYHCGDTALFSDMKLIGDIYHPNVAMIPIGDRFTMGPELAARAAEFIRPKVAIPIHYNTWPPIEQDPTGFNPSGVQVKVMAPGESWEY